MRFKTFENYNDETGELLLIYDGSSPTTWFYITDAIIDGLLDEKLQLDDTTIEEIGIVCFDDENMTGDELYDNIIDDFQGTLQTLFDYLTKEDILDDYPSVEIRGVDEDGEDWEFYYEPTEEVKYQNKLNKTTKRYNV